MSCSCGSVIYADTEDWEIPLCYECYSDYVESLKNTDFKRRICGDFTRETKKEKAKRVRSDK